MDERIAIWNVSHDGEITAVSQDGDTLTIFVSIPYLRRRLKPLGDSFVLTLAGIRRAERRDFVGAASSASPLREELEIGTPEILRTESQSMPVTVETTMGQMILDFQSIRFTLDTAQDTDYKTIERVCDEYWTEWKAKSEGSGSA
ncbi:MAG: hypothetical protein FJ143_04820 [Deltaproteobacteria bacterium]|nr:hypothetical protein [Deltaproteobacteria bacterium]